ncbi:MAG: hypothetical protein ABJM69_02365, partial [Nitratireductor sp.]
PASRRRRQRDRQTGKETENAQAGPQSMILFDKSVRMGCSDGHCSQTARFGKLSAPAPAGLGRPDMA